ncbi:MAG: glycoside hydrolase family 78 protein [Armatimonadota bacterium]|nr:glycoside hydrolase family 78 protein [Armatimonadota bacterium]
MLAALLMAISITSDDPFHGAAWLTVPSKPSAIESARWIWAKTGAVVPTAEDAPAGTVVLTRTFESTDGRNVSLTFSCDNRCKVYLNGKEEASSDDWRSPTSVSLLTRQGANTLRVIATNDVAGGTKNPGGFIASLEIGGRVIVTDQSWQSESGEVVDLGPASVDPWRLKAVSYESSPVFRSEFFAQTVKTATLRVIGLGHFQASINGERVGKAAINQAWSEYDKRIFYQEFDVTGKIKYGPNALGFLLGNGFWVVTQPPGNRAVKGDAMPDFSQGNQYLLRYALEVTDSNDETYVVKSGTETKWTTGPVVFSHIYAGEDFNAVTIPHGWDRPSYEDSLWKAAIVAKPPNAEITKQFWPELIEKEAFRPTEVRQPKPGVYSYVFPQNAMAILRFNVRGQTGQVVRLKPSEVMSESGEVQQLNLWGRDCTFTYVIGSDRPETHQWLFHYNGFQYVELTGAVPKGYDNPKNLPVIESIEMVHVRTDNIQSGAFKSSSDLYNRTHSLVDWAMRSNMSFVLTDCPHREKLGWLECAHLLARTFAYNYDCRDWFKKICMDMRDAQLQNGRVLTVAPRYLMRPPDDLYAFTVEWGAASVLLPWQAYEWYGDKSFLTDNYEMMKRFVDHIDSVSPDGIAPGMLGDWYDYGHGQSPGPSRFTPTDLSATACWAMCIDAAAKTARALSRPSDETKYRAMYDKVKIAFLQRFYDGDKKTFKNSGSPQTANAMALCANLVPEQDRKAVLQAIIDDLEKRDYQQTSGDAGHLLFIRAVAEAGRSDVLHKVYSRTGLGSYGGILAKGLTAMPETWDAITVGSNSLNHCMLGHVMEWFHGWVLGIRQEAGSFGWKNILIAPEIGDLEHAEGWLDTPRGRIEVKWNTKAGFELDATIPPGATAKAIFPMSDHVTLNGKVVVPISDGARTYLTLPEGRHKVVARRLL